MEGGFEGEGVRRREVVVVGEGVKTDNATAELVTSNTCSLNLLCADLDGDGLRVVEVELVEVELPVVSRVNEPALLREVGMFVFDEGEEEEEGGGSQGLTCTRLGEEERACRLKMNKLASQQRGGRDWTHCCRHTL